MSIEKHFDCRCCHHIAHVESDMYEICLTCFSNKPMILEYIINNPDRKKKSNEPDF